MVIKVRCFYLLRALFLLWLLWILLLLVSVAISMEGLKVSEANMVVYVHPSKSKKVSQAVLRELGAMLLK